jgi:hypothetical protein
MYTQPLLELEAEILATARRLALSLTPIGLVALAALL